MQQAQYKFRDWIKSHFAVELNDEPVRWYIETQHGLTHDGHLMAVNCGVIAALVIHGLSQPKDQRDEQLCTLISEYMQHVDGISGVNDAISHLACRRWRVQQSLRLFEWAVAQREQGQAVLPIAYDPFELND